jgi:hypothetical protein
MRFNYIEYLLIRDEYLLMTIVTMSRRWRNSSSSMEVSQELNWFKTEDPDCAAEPGWQDKRKIP